MEPTLLKQDQNFAVWTKNTKNGQEFTKNKPETSFQTMNASKATSSDYLLYLSNLNDFIRL